jgi:hypothetical protein
MVKIKRKIIKSTKKYRATYKTNRRFLGLIVALGIILTLIAYKQNNKTLPKLQRATIPLTSSISPITIIESNSCFNSRWGFGLETQPVGWKCRVVERPNSPINFNTTTQEDINRARDEISILDLSSATIQASIGQFSHGQVCQPKAMYQHGEACSTSVVYKDDSLVVLMHKTDGGQISSWSITGYFYGDKNGCQNIRCQKILATHRSGISGDLTKEETDQLISILRSIQFNGM